MIENVVRDTILINNPNNCIGLFGGCNESDLFPVLLLLDQAQKAMLICLRPLKDML